jgi:hypothetical protein
VYRSQEKQPLAAEMVPFNGQSNLRSHRVFLVRILLHYFSCSLRYGGSDHLAPKEPGDQ